MCFVLLMVNVSAGFFIKHLKGKNIVCEKNNFEKIEF